MAALPATASFVGATVTEDQFKTAISDQRSFLAGLLGTTGERGAALTAIGASLNGVLSKSATYTVLAADRGKLIDFTTAGSDLNLPAVSVGDGFVVAFRNSASSGNVTLKAADTIDGIAGATGIPIGPGESGFAVCNGTVWKTVARQRSYAIQVGTPLIQNPAVLNATTTQAHGLGSEPDYIKVVLECLTGDVEYAAGDRIVISSSLFLDGNYAAVSGITVRADATNVYMKYGPAAMYLNYKTSNSGTATVPSSWKVICTPYKFPT